MVPRKSTNLKSQTNFGTSPDPALPGGTYSVTVRLSQKHLPFVLQVAYYIEIYSRKLTGPQKGRHFKKKVN